MLCRLKDKVRKCGLKDRFFLPTEKKVKVRKFAYGSSHTICQSKVYYRIQALLSGASSESATCYNFRPFRLREYRKDITHIHSVNGNNP